ncbi:bifunctional folylpolyglutamate synthase/dihydrofolate synthase [Microbacter margulisiae]|uniref:Dihydrofolate synthase/folylpolyglutamate synthase n=1 Tax=Microbacter margulisiae TaxID=1350067 RepID=A0A7W5DSF4_9PORP|nr:folylpolyglutamate synthase/dihydrofolate synthase family protein [Microbacter margulisiae]MBB3188230.1 dihydrofolate synthase/folylpolyglutamate synthase [Microbacter margulisiae]
MIYQETIEYLYHQLPVFERIGDSAYKAGLDRVMDMDRILNHPHQNYKTIHVAGTNGKGSTSHMLAAVLQAAGYKTGLYTSPHLKDFRERIRVNGEMITEQYVVDFVERYTSEFESLHPSFFELTMSMAFDYFAAQQVEIAVIEVGLGGRLDSTNIITPILSVITNISFDHQQFLGDTLEKIAAEKAGIMKPNVPVVIGEADGSVKNIFIQHASQVKSPLFFAQKMIQVSRGNDSDQFYTKELGNITMGLKGLYQEKNLATVLSSILLLNKQGISLPLQAIQKGIEHVTGLTGLQGRWQILQKNPLLICDTGHNEAGIRYVMQQLSQLPCRQLHIVFGMVNDKDHRKILPLLPQNALYYFTQAAIPRALPADELQQQAFLIGLKGTAFPSVQEAIQAAKSAAKEGDVIFVGGSSYVVAEAL